MEILVNFNNGTIEMRDDAQFNYQVRVLMFKTQDTVSLILQIYMYIYRMSSG